VEKRKKDSLDFLTGEKPPQDDGKSDMLEITEMNKLRESLGLKPLKQR
jgi:hypothetical protein